MPAQSPKNNETAHISQFKAFSLLASFPKRHWNFNQEQSKPKG